MENLSDYHIEAEVVAVDEDLTDDDEDDDDEEEKVKAFYEGIKIFGGYRSHVWKEDGVDPEYHVLEVCNADAFINLSDCFSKSQNGRSGSCVSKGKDGFLRLDYVALKYAVDAAVEVEFVAKEVDFFAKETRKIQGTIVAYYGKNFDYSGSPCSKKHHYHSVLLDGVVKKPGKMNLV